MSFGGGLAGYALGDLPLTGALRTIRDWIRNPADDPLLELYDVEIDDATTIRLVRGDPTGTGSVDVLGQTYSAAVVEREDVRESIEGDFPGLRLAVSNVDGVAGGYIETRELEGRRVTLTLVPYSLRHSGRPDDRVVQTFTIQDQSYDRQVATFNLAHADYLGRRLWRRLGRFRCQHAYHNRHLAANACFYPSDRLGADTEQDLAVGATADTERTRLHGWRLLNSTRAQRASIHRHVPGHLHFLVTDNATAKDWLNAARNGPFAYKVLAGDFDVWTHVAAALWRAGMVAGLLVQGHAAAEQDNWLLAGEQLDGGTHRAVTRSTVADVTTVHNQTTGSAVRYFRVVRTGTTLKSYYSDKEDADWILHRTETIDLGASARIGLALAVSSSEATDASASFARYRFRSGGLPDCDFTLNGTNGCKVHDNAVHFGGFPAIPRL